MTDKLAIVFDGPPAHESGRFVEVELNGASVSFGEWQENGDYWELVLPEPHTRLAAIEADADALLVGNREARAQLQHLLSWLVSDLSALNRRELLEAIRRIAKDILAALPEHLKGAEEA